MKVTNISDALDRIDSHTMRELYEKSLRTSLNSSHWQEYLLNFTILFNSDRQIYSSPMNITHLRSEDSIKTFVGSLKRELLYIAMHQQSSPATIVAITTRDQSITTFVCSEEVKDRYIALRIAE